MLFELSCTSTSYFTRDLEAGLRLGLNRLLLSRRVENRSRNLDCGLLLEGMACISNPSLYQTLKFESTLSSQNRRVGIT